MRKRGGGWLLGAALVAWGVPTPAAQEPEVRITDLYDNAAVSSGVTPDWGFACLLEGHGKTVLFDAGAKEETFRQNLSALKVDLSKVQAIVLSHEHGDHTNGLAAVGKRPEIPVYYARGFSQQVVAKIAATGLTLVPVTKSVEIFPGYRVSAPMVFKAPSGGEIAEEALLVETREGLVVIVGCAHPGIVPMLRQIKRTTGRPLYMVLGGFHLLQTPADELRRIVADFKSMGVAYVGPTHCTGDEATRLFREAYGDRFIKGGVGATIQAPPQKTSSG